jgi:hypothetical protein
MKLQGRKKEKSNKRDENEKIVNRSFLVGFDDIFNQKFSNHFCFLPNREKISSRLWGRASTVN